VRTLAFPKFERSKKCKHRHTKAILSKEFFSAGKQLLLPENRKVFITILEEPAEVKSRELMFGCLRGEYKIADDFDAPLEDFEEYME